MTVKTYKELSLKQREQREGYLEDNKEKDKTKEAVEDFSRYSSASADFYYNGPPGWSTSGWNDLSLNASASVAISESNSFIVCLIEARYDIEKRTPSLGDTLTAASYGSGSATLYPRLHFTSSAAGWDGGMILGVSASSISSIIGVDRTNISSINGVT